MIQKIISILSQLFHSLNPSLESMDFRSNSIKLCYDILSPAAIDEAEQLSMYIMGTKVHREYAIGILQNKIGLRPRRPLYYVSLVHLMYLPHQTRDIIRYLGDYLDGLVKYTAADLLHNNLYLGISMGINIWRLKNKIPIKLFQNLNQYNKTIYVPAKHDFNVGNRPHLFTSREAVFICILTTKLGEELKILSEKARMYSEDKLP